MQLNSAYLSLRQRKADHKQWTCDEVIVAFEAVAHANNLPVDSINAVSAYFKAELPDGSYLAAIGVDDLAHIVTDKLRRIRVSKVTNEICAPPNRNMATTAAAAVVPLTQSSVFVGSGAVGASESSFVPEHKANAAPLIPQVDSTVRAPPKSPSGSARVEPLVRSLSAFVFCHGPRLSMLIVHVTCVCVGRAAPVAAVPRLAARAIT